MRVLKRFLRNRGGVIAAVYLIILILVAIAAPLVAPYSYDTPDLVNALASPSRTHWFGTDNFGRDVLSRVVYGARASLLVSLWVVGISFAVGVPLGLAAGLIDWLDAPIMRIIDLMFAFPGLLLAIAMVSALGPGLFNAMLAVAVWTTPVYARFTRSLVLALTEMEFVESAHALGGSTWWIAVRHILPNMLGSLAALSTLQVANTLLTASAMSFLGLGVQPPSPEWGAMMAGARDYFRDAWWMAAFPGLAITSVVFAFNLLSDALTDLLPRA